MKPTNYHLFDFMDFDSALQRHEALWKALAPTDISEHDGDIHITLPFQKQKEQEDMAPDTTVPPRHHTLVVRAYAPDILRLFISFCGEPMTDHDAMLQMAEAPEFPISTIPLHLDGTDIIDATGVKRGTIDCSPLPLDHWSDLLPPPQSAPRITFFPDGDPSKGVTLSDDHFSPPRYDALPIGFVTVGDACAAPAERATISVGCTPDECFAGTGERFRKMDLSGQTFLLKNQDGQGVNNRRCYKNIPFYLSSRGYGAFLHTSDYCKLSLADHSTRSVQWLCDGATLDLFLIGGTSPEAILRGYRMLTGFPQMPPLWSFGIWMSRMTYFSADEVEDICHRLRREHYPCDVIHLDTGWFRRDWLCEWKFNPDRFPDPEGFIRRLGEQGFKVSLWQLPYVAEGAEQLQEAKANHYISQPTDGQEEEGKDASSNFSALDYAGTIDFTSPEATQWYKDRLLRPLLDMGVACIKTDFGENIHMDHHYHGMTPQRLNNLYALLYQRAAYDITKETTGEGIIWARAAWAGCQRYPLHWGGDSASTWDGMAGSLRGGLHLGLSGFAFWSHDVPGFHSLPDFMNSPLDEKVYVRWTQMGVFTSHMRYHGTCKREPWHYPAIAPIVRRWWRLRYRLLPYIVEQSEKACRSGMPLLQALLLRHPHDRQCWHIDDEYYFGESFLVCPVMNAADRRDIYLPEGTWVDFFTGERYEGGRWHYDVETPLHRMPVFVRPGSQIPLYPDDVDSTAEMDINRQEIFEITDRGMEV
ncbi:MAG: alpha-xylosidase [Prevotella sp.]|nr:alpha-xylosidase [Prevotella sp.]